MSEAQLHKQVADYLALAITAPDWWSSIPLGGGGHARGGQWKVRGAKAGTPDILLIRSDHTHGGRAHWIELKADKGKVSEAQAQTGMHLMRAGCPVTVCKSLDDVQAMLRHWGFALRAKAA